MFFFISTVQQIPNEPGKKTQHHNSKITKKQRPCDKSEQLYRGKILQRNEKKQEQFANEYIREGQRKVALKNKGSHRGPCLNGLARTE